MATQSDFITNKEIDSTKTYDKYVDVVVRTEKGTPQFFEYLPAPKKDMMDVVYRVSPMSNGKIQDVEIIRTWFKLKAKWITCE